MKHTFKICYEIDAPLAITVVTYLDCEHYAALHESLTNTIEVFSDQPSTYRCHESVNVFSLNWGQSYTIRYVPPATFINYDIKPFPSWLPSFHHLIKTKTILNYYETPARKTTLSELIVELDMPAWLYPFRKFLEKVFEKIKIVKDLEDVAMIDRRAKIFGRDFNNDYLNKHQFLLFKDEYLKYFGENSKFYGDTPEAYKNTQWTGIKNLDYPYVKKFLNTDYLKFC